jgi:N-acetylglucosamine kinase-like BadF-type ATPase
MSSFYLGIDGGGTSTKVSLCDEKLRELKTWKLPASNLDHASLSDIQKSLASLKLAKASDVVGITLASCTGKNVELVKKMAKKIWPKSKIVVGEDTEAAFYACHEKAEGIVVIAGTGSNVHGKSKGKVFQAGGLGGCGSDHGSGYHLSCKVIELLYKTHAKDKKDKDKNVQQILKALQKEFKFKTFLEFVHFNNQNFGDTGTIAQFAKLFLNLAEKGNEICKTAIRQSIRELAPFIKIVSDKLRFKSVNVGMIGSLFHSKFYRSEFQSAVYEAKTPANLFLMPQWTGPQGAIRFALNS